MIQKSTSLEYEPSLEMLRITAEQSFSNRELEGFRVRAKTEKVDRFQGFYLEANALTALYVPCSLDRVVDGWVWRVFLFSSQEYLAHKKTPPPRTLQ